MADLSSEDLPPRHVRARGGGWGGGDGGRSGEHSRRGDLGVGRDRAGSSIPAVSTGHRVGRWARGATWLRDLPTARSHGSAGAATRHWRRR
eukprot:2327032-Rhodomonas_salina.2